MPSKRPTRRTHPCEVTADRLAKHLETYHDKLSGSERDEISRVRSILERIAGTWS